MARKKKAPTKTKNLEDIQNFSSGKIDDDTLKKVKELEEVLGIKSVNPFGTNDPNVLEEKLRDSNLSDLQNLAMKIGIFPEGSKDRLKDKLRKEFKRVTRGARSVSLQQPISVLDPNHPDHEKAKKLMGDGF